MFSAQVADESDLTSGRFVQFVQRLFFPEYTNLSAAEYELHMNALTYLIRKFAHFSEYLILGGCLAFCLSTYQFRAVFRMLIAFFIGVLYAMSDEFHQFFVPGRSMAAFDVCVDSIGVLFGVLIFTGLISVYYLEKVHKM